MRTPLVMAAVTLTLITLAAVSTLPVSAQTPSAFQFTLPSGSLTACWYYGVSFGVTQGQQVTVNWSENTSESGPVSLDFYIVPEMSLGQLWLCQQGPVNVYYDDGAIGTASWTAPITGGYAVLLVNYSYYSVSGVISITPTNATLSASPVGPSSVRREACISAGCVGG